MASFAYAMGAYSFSTDDKDAKQAMRNFILKGDYSEAATTAAFATYSGSTQLAGNIQRRNDEKTMFLTGVYNMHN